MAESKVEAAVSAAFHGQNPLAAPRDATAKNKTLPPVSIPPPASEAINTPKTPADEAIDFFQRPAAPSDAPIAVYELRLEEDGGPNKDRAYTRLPPPYKPYVLRVSLDAGTPPCKNGVFKTNFPLDGGKFDRTKFVERKLPSVFSKPIQIDLPISHAGAFVYWIEYDAPTSSEESKRIKGREGYFNVDPILSVKKRSPILAPDLSILPPKAGGGRIESQSVNIPLDGLNILTLVSKWMGSLAEWKPHLAEASERGYNMIHYTPLQQRGESKSPYSIADQMAFDGALFEEGCSKEEGVKRTREILKTAKEEYGLLSLTDIVLNHTANNSPWLEDHPEAGYSPFNSPHLTPALEIDNAMVEFSANVGAKGLPTLIKTEADLDILMAAFKQDIDALKLYEYYVFDTAREKAAVKALFASQQRATLAANWKGPDPAHKTVVELSELVRSSGIILNLAAFSKRYCTYVEPLSAASLVAAAFVDLNDPEALAEAWVKVLDVLNVDQYKEWKEDTTVALENIKNRVKYTRLEENGPKLGPITKQLTLVESYFTRLPPSPKHPASALALANNGWIWNANPLQNFAQAPSKAYLRREVIVWSDCVKLRYGSGPEDNPWLWSFIIKYVQYSAEMFDGFRIDNCHSTPLHVGIALLDAARVVNPNLYVCAELFTGNEETDVHFVSRLGINSLIREAYNGWDPKEFSRLLYRHGLGKPLGSMDAACLTSPEDLISPTGSGPSRPCLVTPLQGSAPHALLFDLTHDNESPLHKRSAEDALSSGALVTFSFSAIGSNKGFDDLYPKLLDLVGDNRRYEVAAEGADCLTNGISEVKRFLNHLHTEMVLDDFSEGHVHQENDYIVMHRLQPDTQKGYLLVAHCAFSKGSKDRGWIDPIKLRRTKAQFIYGVSLDIPSYEIPVDTKIIRGLPASLLNVTPFKPTEGSDGDGPYTEIVIPDKFPPGSIMVFATQMEGLDPKLEKLCGEGALEAFEGSDLVDLNVLLFRCDGEERDATGGEIGTYNVADLGNLPYCGLEGWMHPLRHIMKFNDLGHPLCAHLRQGTWALDYVCSRLEKQSGTLPHLAKPAAWFRTRFEQIKTQVPPFLRPKYFAVVIFEAYKAARRVAVEQCSEFVSAGHEFTQNLAMCSLQMYGLVQSASLDPGKAVPSLAAGLPHFATGWARAWGRDVFISLRGLFLTTGNFDAAKKHILAFCSTLKHGLIPNLLDSIRSPRYNSRDSPWWMLQNIQDYVQFVPEGITILSEQVPRRFPLDDTWIPWDDPKAYSYSSSVAEIIQEILQRHASGIKFREYNAGPNLDMQMTDKGFDIEIHVDWATGIIFGGSEYNCGTWMDKMGESQKAGTKGKPGTPRDGAPVEIIGLLKSTLRWLDKLSRAGKFPFKGVEAEIDGAKRLITYGEWNDRLQASFEKHFYVPLDPAEDANYAVDSNLISRRGIYKDVYGSGKGREWSDYQLRCNFPIAMVVAPEMFDPAHAHAALKIADERLRSPLGMKTLDASDSQYRGDYDNSNDSTDASIAKGLNYHNGPEWGWPLGYFLRAYLYFDGYVGAGGKKDINDTLHHLHAAILPARRSIQSDPWAGIPELTNRDGAYCHDSCRTQAWSASTLLDFLDDVHKLGSSSDTKS